MIIVRLFLTVIFFFVSLTIGLALLVWIKLRLRPLNPFLRPENLRQADDKTIEGDYKVVAEDERKG